MGKLIKWAVIIGIGYCIYKGIVQPEDIGKFINKTKSFAEKVMNEVK